MYRELRYLFRVATSMKFNTTRHYWILKSRTSASLETHLDQFDSSFIDFTRINCKLIQYQPSKFSFKNPPPFYHIRGLVIIYHFNEVSPRLIFSSHLSQPMMHKMKKENNSCQWINFPLVPGKLFRCYFCEEWYISHW